MNNAVGSPFPLRGVIEGFYGTYFTFPQRNDLIRFAGEHGFNFYLYGPKNDRQHRMRWWEPYPDDVLSQFAQSIAVAREAGVAFCYAISFGVPMDYASPLDFQAVTSKLRAFYDRGCRAFALLVDDTPTAFSHGVNRRNYPDVASAHVDIGNRLYLWLRALDPDCTLCICPAVYHGSAPFGDYLTTLGRGLHRDIDVFYTGPDICSALLTAQQVEAVNAVMRRPVIVWDNYPVNDLTMQSELHIGPLQGRDPDLWRAAKGYMANVMNLPEASKIALLTTWDYLFNPVEYEADAAWPRALRAMAGPAGYEALRSFAENCLSSAVHEEQAPRLDGLVNDLLTALQGGERVLTSRAAGRLAEYLSELDEACYYLKNRMTNLALRQDLLPWIETLEDELWMGRAALAALRALEDREDFLPAMRHMEGLKLQVPYRDKRVGGTRLFALVEYVETVFDQVRRATDMPLVPWQMERAHPEAHESARFTAADRVE